MHSTPISIPRAPHSFTLTHIHSTFFFCIQYQTHSPICTTSQHYYRQCKNKEHNDTYSFPFKILLFLVLGLSNGLSKQWNVGRFLTSYLELRRFKVQVIYPDWSMGSYLANYQTKALRGPWRLTLDGGVCRSLATYPGRRSLQVPGDLLWTEVFAGPWRLTLDGGVCRSVETYPGRRSLQVPRDLPWPEEFAGPWRVCWTRRPWLVWKASAALVAPGPRPARHTPLAAESAAAPAKPSVGKAASAVRFSYSCTIMCRNGNGNK